MSLFTFKAICYYDSYLHKGIAIGFPWGCGEIVKNSPWECGAIGGWSGLICTEGLPLDYLGVAEGLSTDRLGNAERLADRRGIALGLPLGLPLGLAEDGDCQEVAYGLPMEYFGIMQRLPWDCQNFARV